MKFAILRTKKLKTIQQIAIAGMHNDRTLRVLNADRSIVNRLLAGSINPAEKYEKIVSKFNIRERSNGVKAIELVLTFSPEAMDSIDLDKWALENIEWLATEFGRAAILNAQLHLDESTPHIHALVIPLKRKNNCWRLCCRDFLGGASKLSALQDRYALAMKEFDLIRGVKRSEATHQQVKEFYGILQEPEARLPALPQSKNSIFSFRKNHPQMEKLKSYTIKLMSQLTKASAYQNILKAAYFKERAARLRLAKRLEKNEAERWTLINQLNYSQNNDQDMLRASSLYTETPMTPQEARKTSYEAEKLGNEELKLRPSPKRKYPLFKI